MQRQLLLSKRREPETAKGAKRDLSGLAERKQGLHNEKVRTEAGQRAVCLSSVPCPLRPES